jgi:RHS repeat-associated protein
MASSAEVASYTQTRTIDETLAELRGSTTDYYEADGVGSTTSLSGSSGTLGNTYTYDSLGNLTASTGTVRNYFEYTGREFDPETGIYNYRERYFDPSSGRFLSEDPLRFKTSTNFYPYAANNPLRFNDPMGLSAADVQRIFGACQKCTDQLTQSGERRAGSGTGNGWANNIIDFFSLGFRYSGCTRQADLTASCLNFPSSPYDIHWGFTVESTEWGFHHVTMGRSDDPSDPIVVCDPWRNTHYTIPRGPGPGSGGGKGGGGGASF